MAEEKVEETATEAAPAPLGRPTLYTQDLGDLICRGLADGKTLREVCRADGMPSESTVRGWALKDDDARPGFFTQYARAREIGYHGMFDEVLEIADDGVNDWMLRQGDDKEKLYVLNGEHVQRSRLRVDTRKWALSKALPKIYGDRVLNEVTGKDGGPIRFAGVHELSDDELTAIAAGGSGGTAAAKEGQN